MNREEAKKLLPIISAFAEGKDVQMTNGRGTWVDTTDPGFSLNPDHYRIKPEPKEIWVNEYPNGANVTHESEAAAKAGANGRATRTAVRYREVLED